MPFTPSRRINCAILIGILSAFSVGRATAAEPAATQPAGSYDLAVFGATPAGIMSAVAAARGGDRVALVEPSYLIGGMMSGGLTKTDMGRTDAIGGYAREFYDRVLDYYSKTYGPQSEQVFECNKGYYFESSLALKLFNQMLDEAHVTVFTKERLVSAEVDHHRIRTFATENYATHEPHTFAAKMFIDASYEGDLMAQSHVQYRVGREAKSEFNESLAGVTEGPKEYLGNSDHRVQTFNIRGGITDREDLRLPFPKPSVYYPEMCASWVASVKAHHYHTLAELLPNASHWGRINGHYDPNSGDYPGINFAYAEADYEARERIAQHVRDHWLSIWWGLQNDPGLPDDFKKDALSWGVPKDEYMESDHVTPQIYVRTSRRLMGRYFLTQHDLVEDRFKNDTVCMGNYGFDSHVVEMLQTDEGIVREGEISGSTDLYAIPYRCLQPYGIDNLLVTVCISASNVAYSSLRMEPVYMMLGQAGGLAAHLAIEKQSAVQDVPVEALQAELTKTKVPLEPTFRPWVELHVKTPGPYKPGTPIEFEVVSKKLRAPIKSIAWNFDGSGAVQSTEMNPTYTFKQSKNAQVLLSVTDGEGKVSQTQTVDLAIGDNVVPDVEIAHRQAKLKGRWNGRRGNQMEYYYRMGVVDVEEKGDEPSKSPAETKKAGDGKDEAVFTTMLPRAGKWLVALAFPAVHELATNVPVTVTSREGEKKLTIDQKTTPPFAFIPLGTYHYDKGTPASVKLTNDGTNGGVGLDTVRWIWQGE